jgi:hypothetical protein
MVANTRITFTVKQFMNLDNMNRVELRFNRVIASFIFVTMYPNRQGPVLPYQIS